MPQFEVEGGARLSGVFSPVGNKNAALPLLAATLLTRERVVLRNVPRIDDVNRMMEMLTSLGVSVEELAHDVIAVQAADVTSNAPREDLAQKLRGSILFAAPLLARLGEAEIPTPGGDRIGRRQVDTHLMAMRDFGATAQANGTSYSFRAAGRLKGANILLDEASVTATENAVMAAVLADGPTEILNAASEPHVQELCRFLNDLGANIVGMGTNRLYIDPVDSLGGGDHTLEADYLEVGSIIVLAAITGSDLVIENAHPSNLRMTLLTLSKVGINVEIDGDDIRVPPQTLAVVEPETPGAIIRIDDGPWPGFPADMMSIAVVAATQSVGTTLFFEKMYESRLFFVDRLIEMGARIVMCDPHRVLVIGPSKIYPGAVASPDIRAGMALLIATMAADGGSTIQNIGQIDRGYERIDERLNALGARIKRID